MMRPKMTKLAASRGVGAMIVQVILYRQYIQHLASVNIEINSDMLTGSGTAYRAKGYILTIVGQTILRFQAIHMRQQSGGRTTCETGLLESYVPLEVLPFSPTNASRREGLAPVVTANRLMNIKAIVFDGIYPY